MKKEYRNKLIATALLILGIMIFSLVDGYFSYDQGNNPNTEQVNDK